MVGINRAFANYESQSTLWYALFCWLSVILLQFHKESLRNHHQGWWWWWIMFNWRCIWLNLDGRDAPTFCPNCSDLAKYMKPDTWNHPADDFWVVSNDYIVIVLSILSTQLWQHSWLWKWLIWYQSTWNFIWKRTVDITNLGDGLNVERYV